MNRKIFDGGPADHCPLMGRAPLKEQCIACPAGSNIRDSDDEPASPVIERYKVREKPPRVIIRRVYITCDPSLLDNPEETMENVGKVGRQTTVKIVRRKRR